MHEVDVTHSPVAPAPLGPMPTDRSVCVVDERLVHARVATMFDLARDVERWPALLPHYRWVRMLAPMGADRAGVVEMAAWRPFGVAAWPTWWVSEMSVDHTRPAIRFRHIRGITTGMDVEWTFTAQNDGTLVRIVHVWNGPRWPVIGRVAARAVIGPIFVHGIASRTLAGLAAVAEGDERRPT